MQDKLYLDVSKLSVYSAKDCVPENMNLCFDFGLGTLSYILKIGAMDGAVSETYRAFLSLNK